MKGVTFYSGLSKFYFRHLLSQIIKVGDLRRPGITILDFGCGTGELKRLLKGAKVVGYDIVPSLSDVKDWRKVDFDLLVANEVFYSFKEEALEKLLKKLEKKDRKMELVVGISRLGLLNKLGMVLLGKPGAHSAARMAPEKELEILKKHCQVIRHRSVWGLADVYSLVFDPLKPGASRPSKSK